MCHPGQPAAQYAGKSARRVAEPFGHTRPMSFAWLLLPDFLLILSGFVICRATALNRSVWESAEKLVYYVFFPVLLFNAIVKSPLQPAQTAGLAAAGVGTIAVGVALAMALGRWPGVPGTQHASGAQVAFRFNSFIALALAERLAGPPGLAWTALLIALCVPLCNVAAVWPLARHGGHAYHRELLRNPLILATVAGLLANLAGLNLPAAAETTLQRIGSAALPIGLMAAGAGLQIGGLKAAPGLAAGLLTIRHAVLPLVAIGLSLLLNLPTAQAIVLVAFASLPTASSAYVLAARMGGDGGYVAGLVTLSTLLGMVSIAFWLAVHRGLQ